VISRELSIALRDAGLVWHPESGDRFQLDLPEQVEAEIEADVFTVSEMTIEARRYPTGTILAFNGTTEWALDSVAFADAVWLPREDQLRELLGDAFHRLERAGDRYRVVATVWDEVVEFVGDEPSAAYGEALLHVLAGGRSVPGSWDAPPA
jgi:hypothetical protein